MIALIVLPFVFRWSTIEVFTNENHSDVDQAYAAGLVESLVTSDLIELAWQNSFDGYCSEPLSAYCRKLKNYVDVNAAWMQEQIDSLADTDPYWHQASHFVELKILIKVCSNRHGYLLKCIIKFCKHSMNIYFLSCVLLMCTCTRYITSKLEYCY